MAARGGPAMSPSLQIDQASCRFQHASGREVQALNRLSLSVPPGEFVCLVGRSGGGKSTLLRAIAGLTSLSEGTVRVDGQLVTGPNSDRGMVFQEDAVFPWMRVGSNVEFSLKLRGVPARERRDAAARWLGAVGLDRFAGSWPKELSGGMRKRVALAMVFAAGARVLLMDEPFGALDYVTRLTLYDLLLQLWSETGATVLFVTHDLEEALVLGDRVVIVRDGAVADDRRIRLPRPRDADVRATPEGVALTQAMVQQLRGDIEPGAGPEAGW